MATNNNLQKNLKKYFYSSIGLAASAAEIVQKSVDGFSKHGKVNEAEGKKIVDEAMKNMEERYRDALHKFVQSSIEQVSKLEKRNPTKRATSAAPKEAKREVRKVAAKGKKIMAKIEHAGA